MKLKFRSRLHPVLYDILHKNSKRNPPDIYAVRIMHGIYRGDMLLAEEQFAGFEGSFYRNEEYSTFRNG
ncbi:MAG: hypothetical protein MJY75_04955, partial [Bacteroidaceae bacterium]|nr:hypothetical protein [Bacteroidaceae bacterium]